MTLLLYLPRHLWVNSAASPTNKVNPLVIFLSYGNQSIDQQNKSTEWFLYDGNIDRWYINRFYWSWGHILGMASKISLILSDFKGIN